MNLIKKMGSLAAAMLVVPAMYSGVPISMAEQAQGGLYINEVCTQNKNCFTDSLGRASDWIELYNGGNSDIDLSGFGLSENEDKPMKYIFPTGTVIKQGEYLLVVSNKEEGETSELNTGFSLSKSGETVFLSSSDGNLLQKLEVPSLSEDTTYGRSSDGSYSVMAPTPAAENISTPAEPVFSLESGFYSENDVKELTITANASDIVYYTLDGSDPTTSETAKPYTEAIQMYDRSIEENVYSKYQQVDDSPYSTRLSQVYEANPEKFDKATVVRAAAKSSDNTFSRVITKTFFVMNDEKLRYYSGIPVVSLVTDPANLFDKDKGIYVAGQQYLDWLENPENDIDASIANFFSSGKEWEREADLTYFKDGAIGFSQKIGIRIRGASTRNSQAKSFNVFARSKYGDSKLDYKLIDDNYSAADGKIIKRYDSFGLRAVTWVDRLRERIVHSALQDIPALATYDSDRCMLFIDGELWGMYEITEKTSDYYIQSNYGVPSENVTIYKNGELEEGPDDEPRNIQHLGVFCRDNDLSVAENYDYVKSVVDIDSLIESYCTGLYIDTWDWPNYNYFMWRYNGEAIDGNPYSDGKWRFGSFDYDYSVGLAYEDFGGVESYQHDSFRKMDEVKDAIPTVIFTKLLENPEFKQKFAERFYSYAYSVFEPSKMVSEINAEEEKYMNYITMTAWRWYNGTPASDIESFLSEQKSYYHDEFELMRTYFQKRGDYAIENMRNYLGISNEKNFITVEVDGSGIISVNSVDTELSNKTWAGLFESGKEITLTAKPAEGYTFDGWSGAVNSDSDTITVTADKALSLVCSFKMKEYQYGDTDMDGTINVADLLIMSKYLHGKESFTKMQFLLADMNQDDTVDVFDLLCLRKELLK
ncbi:CotH kinase family protein [Ruminococcus flavefaciens]|uniref:CotH kinase family protein n=1 Tax=Ruminococcus flavefaciens TaxID=1265 RepID=UPI0004914D1A|nr:CotH kinase family protein [Ruminococcus flavefaciens]